VLVALAGPLANLALGVGGAFALQAIPQSPQFFDDITHCLPGETLLQCVGGSLPWWSLRGEQLLFAFIVVNIGLFLINIIPLYPLDGYRVVFALLPSRQAVSFRRSEPYMELIILGIIFLLPMLLQLANAPPELNPLYWISLGINAIVFAIVNPAYVYFPAI
jgi:Zn-dependent protease